MARKQWLHRLLRVPVVVYRLGCGFVLGHRFLLLTHRGRRTGRLYRTVLEVLQFDRATREVIVMSGFGRTSNWLRNIAAGGGVRVDLARLHFAPEARMLGSEEAAAVIAGYEHRNRLLLPIVRRVLSRLAGFHYDSSSEARLRLVGVLPLVGLRPRGRCSVESFGEPPTTPGAGSAR